MDIRLTWLGVGKALIAEKGTDAKIWRKTSSPRSADRLKTNL